MDRGGFYIAFFEKKRCVAGGGGVDRIGHTGRMKYHIKRKKCRYLPLSKSCQLARIVHRKTIKPSCRTSKPARIVHHLGRGWPAISPPPAARSRERGVCPTVRPSVRGLHTHSQYRPTWAHAQTRRAKMQISLWFSW